MKAKELNVEHKEKSQEEIAKKVIEDIYDTIESRKKAVIKAEKKLTEVLEKDIEEIKDEDSKSWDW